MSLAVPATEHHGSLAVTSTPRTKSTPPSSSARLVSSAYSKPDGARPAPRSIGKCGSHITRSLLAHADQSRGRRLFAYNPWDIVRHLLQLCDNAIESGWHPNTDDQDYTDHPCLDAMAAVEKHVTLGPHQLLTAALALGHADDLSEVLELFQIHGATWAVGIDAIELRDRRNDLPPASQKNVAALHGAGVTIAESYSSTETPKFTIVHGQDDCSTAEAATRCLTNVSDRGGICNITGDSTAVLDQQLVRLAPARGAPNSSLTPPSAQVLPTFLSDVPPARIVRRVAEFLHLSFGSDHSVTLALTDVPGSVPSTLLSALAPVPRVSGDPASAWMEALEALKTPVHVILETATQAWEIAQTLDGILRAWPPEVNGKVGAISSVQPALDWLTTRLRSVILRQRKAAEDNSITALFLPEVTNYLVPFGADLFAFGIDTEALNRFKLGPVGESVSRTGLFGLANMGQDCRDRGWQ